MPRRIHANQTLTLLPTRKNGIVVIANDRKAITLKLSACQECAHKRNVFNYSLYWSMMLCCY